MEEKVLDPYFTRNSLRAITSRARDKEIIEKYQFTLLQIQLAAEGGLYSTTLPAEDIGIDLVVWLLKRDFTLYQNVRPHNIMFGAANKRTRIIEPGDYKQEDAVTITVIW